MVLFAATKHVFAICEDFDTVLRIKKFVTAVDFTVVCLVLTIIKRKWFFYFVDYDNTSVQGDLKHHVYMKVPRMLNGISAGKVCILLKSLYIPIEAPRI